MAIQIESVNGVDKLTIDATNIIYNFPTARVAVNTATTEIAVQLAGAQPTTTKFASLLDNFGTANAEAYVDYVANNGYFFGANSTAALIPANAIFIDDIGQLPTPILGVIDFGDDGNFYIFTKVVDVGGLEVRLGNNSFMGSSQELAGLANATVTIDTTCTVKYWRFNNCALTFDDATGAYDWSTVNFYDCPNCIEVANADNIIFDNFGFINSYGFVVSGTVATTIALEPNCIFRSVTNPTATFFLIESTAVIGARVRVGSSRFATSFAGQTAFEIEAGASIGVEAVQFEKVSFAGPGTALAGVNGDSDIANFTRCTGTGVVNSTSIANMYMTNNATNTVIGVIGTRYAMAGVTQLGSVVQRFTHDVATNTLEYTSSVPRIFRIQAGYTVFSGTNNVVGVYIGVNKTGGALDPTADRISESEMYTTTGGTRPESGIAQCIVTLEQGDRIYIIVQNNTATNDVRIEFLNCIVETANA